MRQPGFMLLTIALVLFMAGMAFGTDVGSHQVIFDFLAINELEITGVPDLSIATAFAGQQPDNVADTSSRLAITTNGSDKKITAAIGTAMPPGVTLEVHVAVPPDKGTSAGFVPLGPSPAVVVTGISNAALNGITITYRLSATVQAGVILPNIRTVTFALTD